MENFKLFKIPEVQYLDFEVISEENMFYLNLIEVYPKFRQQGFGIKQMEIIIKYCTENELNICLYPDPECGTSIEILHNFYEKLGFILNEEDQCYYIN